VASRSAGPSSVSASTSVVASWSRLAFVTPRR
jgi:hypothetical protein